MAESAHQFKGSDYWYDARSFRQAKRRSMNPNGCMKLASSCCCCCCQKGIGEKPLTEISVKRGYLHSNKNLKRKSSCMGAPEVPLLKSRRRLSNRGYPKPTSSVDRKFVVDLEYMTFLDMLTKDEEDEDRVGDGLEEMDVDEELDPQYKSFFENLREDGKSYILEMERMEETSLYIKYEEDGSTSLELNRDVGTNLGNNSGGRRKRDITDDEDFRPECLNQVRREAPPRSSSPKLGPIDDSHPFLDELKHGITCEVDESYQMFMSYVRIRGGSLIMESDDGIVPYGEYNQCPLDSEIPARENVPHFEGPKLKPSSPLNSYDSQTDEDDQEAPEYQNCVLSEFEKKLLKCLKVPYNDKEFNDKHREATDRKQQEKHRNLRGRSVSYATETKSRSYLDHHSDLAELIDAALKRRDVTRALTLLRCLFFYYENVSHEGSFVPWTDPSFLKKILGPDYRW